MMKLKFAIYTKATGYTIHEFDSFDAEGNSCFDQAVAYAIKINDGATELPQVYVLSDVPVNLSASTISRSRSSGNNATIPVLEESE